MRTVEKEAEEIRKRRMKWEGLRFRPVTQVEPGGSAPGLLVVLT